MLRNAILITVDALRYDRLSVADYDRPVSPTMDSLAVEGAFCDETIATGPSTRTSFPGILCSTYPLMYGGYAQLTQAREVISEVFRERGFRTVGVNTNTQLHSQFGWDRGFDLYYDSEQTLADTQEIDINTDTAESSRTHDFLDKMKSKAYSALDQEGFLYSLIESLYRRLGTRSAPHDSAAATVDRTLNFLDTLPNERPLFLWIHFMEPHSPYVPLESYRDQFLENSLSEGEMWALNDKVNTNEEGVTDQEMSVISDLYDASVREVDNQIERLIDGLRERDLWNNSVSMICGDHGEAFGEHGNLAHGGRPYDELVRVPLIVRLGEENIAFQDGVTSTIDIAPTLLDATLKEPNIPEKFHGVSLCPVVRGETSLSEDRSVFSQIASGGWRKIDLNNRITACRTDKWKYITSVRDDDPDELYYIPDDQYEQRDCAVENPHITERMADCVEDHYAQAAYERYDIEGAVEPDHLGDQLEALGYTK
jgi:arylsulfatase A-like enzyme